LSRGIKLELFWINTGVWR